MARKGSNEQARIRAAAQRRIQKVERMPVSKSANFKPNKKKPGPRVNFLK